MKKRQQNLPCPGRAPLGTGWSWTKRGPAGGKGEKWDGKGRRRRERAKTQREEKNFLRKFKKGLDKTSFLEYNGLVASGCGGIGRRARFRFLWGQLREGSSPFTRILIESELLSKRKGVRIFFCSPSAWGFAGMERLPSAGGFSDASGSSPAYSSFSREPPFSTQRSMAETVSGER